MAFPILADLVSDKPELSPAHGPNTMGWLCPATAKMLDKSVDPGMRTVLEVGTWTGLSTRRILNLAPNAHIYCLDTWGGSIEMPGQFGADKIDVILETLWDAFVHRCWDYRDRIHPVRATSREGLKLVSEAGIKPEFCYIDGSHQYEDAKQDIEDSIQYFPEAVLVGDDYTWHEVKRAVDEAKKAHACKLELIEGRGWRLS